MFDNANDPGSLRRGSWRYFPVVPGRMEFAVAVRQALLADRPAVVAVELPSECEQGLLRAVDRLPQISALMYPHQPEAGLPENGEEDAATYQMLYVPVEPCDPFIEAVRTAREIGAEIVFIEPSLGDRPHVAGAYPDTYAVRRLGLEPYLHAYRLQAQPHNSDLEQHAGAMAWRLQGRDPFARTMVVVSLNILHPLLDAMQTPQDEAPKKLSSHLVQVVNPDPECLAEICCEMPYLQRRYEQWRIEPTEDILVDRQRGNLDLLREAEALYGKNTGDSI
ncbi:MAG TPA: hypothetical protein VFQ91_05420, partial [Bryobacteraceae bacterium]|nr:hypothetical protein [Bryobacteraceae bacterium]